MTTPAHVNKKSVNRVIKQQDLDGTPLENRDLRELAAQIVTILGAHPSCVRNTEETIMRLMRNGTVVHKNNVLRPRVSGETATMPDGIRRMIIHYRKIEVRAERLAAERHREYARRQYSMV